MGGVRVLDQIRVVVVELVAETKDLVSDRVDPAEARERVGLDQALLPVDGSQLTPCQREI